MGLSFQVAGVRRLVCIGLALLSIGSCRTVTAPPDRLRQLIEADDVDGVSDDNIATLRALLGTAIPDLELHNAGGGATRLSDFAGSKLAVFGAIGPCRHTLEWSKELSSSGWEVEGRKLIVLRMKSLRGASALDLALKDAPSVYETPWPMPGHLNALRGYPFMLYVSETRELVGFKLGTVLPAEFVEAEAGGGQE